MTRVLITGVAGFIGSHLADALLADGHRVYGIDNLTTGRMANVAADVEFFDGSIADSADTGHHFDELSWCFDEAEPEVVVHCAASYSDPDDHERDILTNAYGTARVVRACKGRAIRRLIYLQTSLCYGLRPPPYPMPVSHPLDPHGSYAISKTAGEAYVRDSRIDWISFRLANIYGPRNLSGPVPTFYKRLKAGESCTVVDTRRDFVYVADLVELLKRAVDGEGQPGVYHVSTGGDWPIERLYRAIADALDGPTPEPRCVSRGPDDTWTLLLDPTKTLLDFLGWRAGTTLEAGIAETVKWYEQHGVGRTYTHLRGV